MLEPVQHTFVTDLTLVLGVAAITSVVFRALRQPSILGYLFTGLLVGPYLPIPLFADPERMKELSEFGVILVMFSVGLEFRMRRLLQLLPTSGFAAIVQIGAMMWTGYAFARLAGFTAVEALFLGSGVAISSTMVVAKVYEEHRPDRSLRDLVFGILVVQDVVAIVLIGILTAVAEGSTVTADAITATVLQLVGVLAALLVGGLLIVPRLVRFLTTVASREMLVVTMAGLTFGAALLAEMLGYSVALGAFLAGILCAESGRGRQIEHVIAPLRDLFAAVFFVSVGMTVDPTLAIANLPTALTLALVVIVGQLLFISLAGIVSGNGLRRSLLAGGSLGQLGEFAFIMVGIGLAAGVVSSTLYPIVVTAAVITAFTTPLVFRGASVLAGIIERKLPAPLRTSLGLYESWLDRIRQGGIAFAPGTRLRRNIIAIVVDGLVIGVLVLGAALGYRIFQRLTDELFGLSPGVANLVLAGLIMVIASPFFLGLLRNARRIGLRVGEAMLPLPPAGRADLGMAPRRMIAVALELIIVIAIGLPVLVVVQPVLPLAYGAGILVVSAVAIGIYSWRTAANLRGHVRAASEVLFDLLKAQTSHPEVEAPEELEELLPGFGSMSKVVITGDSPATGKTLRELDLSAQSGAAIVAVRHRDGNVVSPTMDTSVTTGDTLVLVGPEQALAEARRLLAGT